MVWARGEAGSICFWNFNSMLVLGSICFAEFPRAKFRLHTALSIIWQNSTNVSTTTCVLVRRDYAQKRVNAQCSVLYADLFFLLNLFDVRWPNEIWWHIFQENVVEEDECQQLCGDQVTILIAPDPPKSNHYCLAHVTMMCLMLLKKSWIVSYAKFCYMIMTFGNFP